MFVSVVQAGVGQRILGLHGATAIVAHDAAALFPDNSWNGHVAEQGVIASGYGTDSVEANGVCPIADNLNPEDYAFSVLSNAARCSTSRNTSGA